MGSNPPESLELVTSFKVPDVAPWGRGHEADQQRRGEIRLAVDLAVERTDFDWFFFIIKCDYNPSPWHVTKRACESWKSDRTQGPDDALVRGVPKLH